MFKRLTSLFKLRPFAPVRLFVAVALAGSLLSLAIGLIYARLQPKKYSCTARLKIEWEITVGTNGPQATYEYDPGYISKTLTLIRSDTILTNVINDLNLTTDLGKKHSQGKPFMTAEAIAWLNGCMEVTKVHGGKLIAITFYSNGDSENELEAERLANTVAGCYQASQQKNWPDVRKQTLARLGEQEQKLNTEMAACFTNTPAKKTQELQRQLNDIVFEESHLTGPPLPTEPVVLVNHATPNWRPIERANPISLPAIGLVGLFLGLGAVFLSHRLNHPPVTT